MAMSAAPIAAVTPMPVESSVGKGGRQRREGESNAKSAKRNNFGLAHVLLLLVGRTGRIRSDPR
jgi:hypothetical protein